VTGTITDVAGLRVGHWTDKRAATGCTVVLFPDGTVASAEVRGGAPASRELELLDPGRTVARVDALVLTGGSAFGLAAADGVMRYCEEAGRGAVTPAGRVPIVVALALFDLAVGDGSVRPGADAGYAACQAATDGPVALGLVGAGTGATVGPAGGTPGEHRPSGTYGGEGPPGGTSGAAPGGPQPGGTPGERRPGGIVSGSASVGELRVATLVVVNAAGTPGGSDEAALQPAAGPPDGRAAWGLRTTIGLVATNARLDKLGCRIVAEGAHDGLARAVFPPHTRYDGDAFVVASVGGGTVDADVDAVRALAVHLVARSVGSLAE
jgi:L-aminopeptidase/D-esterase-like protein